MAVQIYKTTGTNANSEVLRVKWDDAIASFEHISCLCLTQTDTSGYDRCGL